MRTYDHFCVLARALERVGDRWSLLVVRDLLTGPKRFTDLMDRLGGLTPKTLTQRLRELQDCGVVVADRQPGRREVRYALTPAGAELAPAVDALSWWGLRYAWRPPRPGEPLHPEHLLRAIAEVINRTGDDHAPARWHFRFRDAGEFALHSDGHGWALAAPDPGSRPDVTITATAAAAVTRFVADPSPERAAELDIDLRGDAPALRRFERLLGTFATAAGSTLRSDL